MVDCGLWYLAEYENGTYRLNRRPREFTDVAHYIKRQERFRHLSDTEIKEIILQRDAKWQLLDKQYFSKN